MAQKLMDDDELMQKEGDRGKCNFLTKKIF
jgi:hypothetical protein